MKIFELEKCVRIEGIGLFPKGKIFVTEKDNDVLAFTATTSKADEVQYHIKWDRVQDINGDTFGSKELVMTYLSAFIGDEVEAIETILENLNFDGFGSLKTNIANAIPDREDIIRGSLIAQTTTQVFPNSTVPAGKVLKVINVSLSCFNNSVSAIGNIVIKNGDEGTELSAVVIPMKPAAGATPPQASHIVMPFIQPPVALVDLKVVINSGTITYSAIFTGYFEDI